jgi:hypothetical protein
MSAAVDYASGYDRHLVESLRERAATTMHMTLEEITPQAAAELLASQVGNRRIKPEKVAEWTSDMQAGRWQPIPQPIMIDLDGRLIDGQHRLTAVVRSQSTVLMWVARNVPGQMRRYVDGGVTRTAADVLRMEHGVTNQISAQASVKLVISYQRMPNIIWNGSNAKVGKQPIIDEYLTDPDTYQQAVACGNVAGKSVGPGLWLTRTSYAALYVLVHRYSATPDLWDEWHRGVRTGEELSAGDPRLLLRSARRRGVPAVTPMGNSSDSLTGFGPGCPMTDHRVCHADMEALRAEFRQALADERARADSDAAPATMTAVEALALVRESGYVTSDEGLAYVAGLLAGVGVAS